MAYQNIEIGAKANTQYKSYVCDTSSDLINIPANFADVAFVIGTGSGGETYMYGTNGWTKI